MVVIESPLRYNGKKTKLLEFIGSNLPSEYNTFFDVFMGSGVVGFNFAKTRGVFTDINPLIIRFFNSLKFGTLSPDDYKNHLDGLSEPLRVWKVEKYMEIRERFNKDKNLLDFLFINRTCFNGIMRFNKKGGFNTPFCQKPDLLTPKYTQSVKETLELIKGRMGDFEFYHRDFEHTILMAKEGDLVYLDPPYYGLENQYISGWDEMDEERLFNTVNSCPAKVMLSTWVKAGQKRNPMVDKYWAKFRMATLEHKYTVGPKAEHRNNVTEALFMNY